MSKLADSRRLSLYDDAYLNLAHYFYENEFGTPERELFYLERAVSGSGQERFFEADSYIAFLFHLFVLQVNHSYYREALDTAYDLADLEGTSDLMGQINPTIEQIKSLACYC